MNFPSNLKTSALVAQGGLSMEPPKSGFTPFQEDLMELSVMTSINPRRGSVAIVREAWTFPTLRALPGWLVYSTQRISFAFTCRKDKIFSTTAALKRHIRKTGHCLPPNYLRISANLSVCEKYLPPLNGNFAFFGPHGATKVGLQ